ncbi:MAG TPA: ABC transporter permease [Phycisphaerae bacterium]|nr:ABC transporter permease [Phycisphaerae bacterium]
MFFFRVCIMALRSLWIHPLRSILATLGVIIGVAAVVAAMAILEGMGARMATGFESMGSNKLFVMPEVERRGRRAVGNFDSLELEDAEAIERSCQRTIQRVMPQIMNSVTVKFLSKTTNATILGATDVYPIINSHNVSEGEFFTRANVQGKANIVVLGAKVKQELFGGIPAIEEKIKISGMSTLGTRTFTVVGVMEEKGNVGFTDVDRQIIIPITTAMDKVYGVEFIQTIVAEARSAEDADIEEAKNEIKKLLRQRHKIRAGQQDDFQVQAQKEFVAQFGQFQKIIGVVLGSIAGISLVVGGIGIMNIMLVAVTERTREIGVRMAMGAQRMDVMKQFLVEASFVSFLGGAMGVLMGWGLANTIERLTRVFETLTSAWSIVAALAMATGTGIVSGIYPAWKASRLDPVEALRYE